MTRPDLRDFENLLTRPDPTREILKPFDPTRPDPRDFENLLTRPDPTREILKRNDPTRPDPRDFETPLTRPAGWVMTCEKPCYFLLVVCFAIVRASSLRQSVCASAARSLY